LGESGAIRGQRGKAFARARVAFVGDVVGGAGEGVDRLDRRTQRRRAEQRGDREVLVMFDRYDPRFSMVAASGRFRSIAMVAVRSFDAPADAPYITDQSVS